MLYSSPDLYESINMVVRQSIQEGKRNDFDPKSQGSRDQVNAFETANMATFTVTITKRQYIQTLYTPSPGWALDCRLGAALVHLGKRPSHEIESTIDW